MMDDTLRTELRALLIQVIDGSDSLSEREENRLVLRIQELSPDPEITDYMFGLDYDGLSVDDIIVKVAAYRPIIL